ncbi:hypothetical protein Ancab_034309 [Ancistrocladus abbreviatus]
MQIIKEALATGAKPNKSDAFTINGQPRDTQPCSNTSIFRTVVDHDKTYLLRIINVVMNEEMFFMVADHKLTVVGIDAAYVKPILTKYIMITPGQTMDVLITANQSTSHYYIAARAFAGVVFSNATTTIVFQALASTNHPIDVPKSIQTRLFVTISVNTYPCEQQNATCSGPNGDRLSNSLNNITFYTLEIDILQAYYKSIKDVYKGDFPYNPQCVFNYTADPMLSDNYTMSDLNGTRVRILDCNSIVEIVFQGTNVMNASENHPMHLHRFGFYLVGYGFGNFDENKSPSGYNLVDPPELNTIGVPKNGWATVS